MFRHMVTVIRRLFYAAVGFLHRVKAEPTVIIVLIRPSGYLEDGSVRGFRRGLLPSNSLMVLQTLFLRLFEQSQFASLSRKIYTLDDAISRDHKKIYFLQRWYWLKKKLNGLLPGIFPDLRVIACFVGVQTHELPRARDLAREWQRRCSAFTALGGFATSVLNTLYYGIEDPQRPDFPQANSTELPPEIADLVENNITVFCGEAETPEFSAMVSDMLAGAPKQIYRAGTPDLYNAPLPEWTPNNLKGLLDESFTIETARGCVFSCSFCSIINFLGRTVRPRDPSRVVEFMKNGAKQKPQHYFLTDDDFIRNPHYAQILDGVSDARRHGYDITFMTEMDVAALKIDRAWKKRGRPGLFRKLADAGCTTIFFGVESVRQANLETADKGQNDIDAYSELTAAMEDAGIRSHAGYIIGFPFDTLASVEEDIATLSQTNFRIASFFFLIPLQGSEDHAKAVRDGVPMDPDPNWYNSFRPVCNHPLMTREEWARAYNRAWEIFYRSEEMIRKINREKTLHHKLGLLGNYMMWRMAHFVYGVHPMIAGLGEKRDTKRLRPGTPQPQHAAWIPATAHRAWITLCRRVRHARLFWRELQIFKEVIAETGLVPLAYREATHELRDELHNVWDWISRTFGAYRGRAWLDAFWLRYAAQRETLLWNMIWHARALPHAFTELIYWVRATLTPTRYHHRWLKSFWVSYRSHWRDVRSPLAIARHVLVIPLFVTELMDQIKFFAFVFPIVFARALKS